MLLLPLLLPLFSIIAGLTFGFALGCGVSYIVVINMLIIFVISCYFLINVIHYGFVYSITLSEWFSVDFLTLDWTFLFDSLTLIMLFIVTFISLLVHFYSISYMSNDPHLPRFLAYLSLFTFFMLSLITAGNAVQMFIGWEGVGVSSYLLINFWFTRIQANKSAIKAMLINRVGDFFILLGLFTIYYFFGSLDYEILFSMAASYAAFNIEMGLLSFSIIDLICICLFLGAMGKSAQLGLHTWLPDAMEGPTPVSALIHAATMVTAGVFLLARCSYMFELAPKILNVIMCVGAMTAFFAATTGLFQNDMKKVIAYSTCSQLGYMVFACGLSSYEVAIFHLSNHAFFKALLFLGAGSIIHAVSDEQDMRKLGALKIFLPFSYSIMVIGSLALIGFPFLSGFYSKDVILEIAFAKFTVGSLFCYILGSLAAFCTAFYSTRLLFLVFLSNSNGYRVPVLNAHEGNINITLPLFVLSFFSLCIGFLSKELFIGFGTNFWQSSLFVLPEHNLFVDIEFLSLAFKLLPLGLTIFGVFSAYRLYSLNLFDFFKLKIHRPFVLFYTFFSRKWFFDRVYNEYITAPLLNVSYVFTYKTIDRGFIEFFGPVGLTMFVRNSMRYLRPVQSGNLAAYLFIFLFFIFLFCCIG